MLSKGAMTITVTPAATGRQLIRYSLPFKKGFLNEDQGILASDGKNTIPAAVRPLTFHPNTAFVRRCLVTFPYKFRDQGPISFKLVTDSAPSTDGPPFAADVDLNGDTVTIKYENGVGIRACLIAPPRISDEPAKTETIESNAYFIWKRIILPDQRFPRVIEVRADALGGVAVIAHLQRNLRRNGYAPRFGWDTEIDASSAVFQSSDVKTNVGGKAIRHRFEAGASCEMSVDGLALRHPMASFNRRGEVKVKRAGNKISYRYLRSEGSERIPMQESSWRKAEFTLAPVEMAPLAETLEYPHVVTPDPRLWDELYGVGTELDLSKQPELGQIVDFHKHALTRCAVLGDDWGHITEFNSDKDSGSVFGLNRLNLAIPMFEDAYRSGDTRLLKTALLWCENFHDLSLWWGPGKTGGARYPVVFSIGQKAPRDDRTFMWRSNSSWDFCTKGFYSFLIAYEHTGDPRMLEALRAQTAYASKHVHAVKGLTRNVGCVLDFIRLYRNTGDKAHLDDALRLFHELREFLTPRNLFTESGRQPHPDRPFVEDDSTWRQHPYEKPYILGYALLGLPELLKYAPDEPKLRDVVKAVGDFLADCQDPLGAWRYPHPRSSLNYPQLAIEGAWQLAQVDRAIGPQQSHLDAIERTLRQRIHFLKKTGKILSWINGWEVTTGKVKERPEVNNLYEHPEDRDFTRDYDEGEVVLGSCSPDGLVYFADTLRFYAQSRPLSRLLEPPEDDEPLARVLKRVEGN